MLMTSENMIGKKAHPIDDVKGVRLVMIICNHCPYVLFRMPAISKIVKEYNDRVHLLQSTVTMQVQRQTIVVQKMHQSLWKIL